MDGDIDDMVSGYFFSMKIIVDRKGKVGERPVDLAMIFIHTIKREAQFFPAEGLRLDIGVIAYIGAVIQVHGGRKTIAADRQHRNDPHQ